MMKWWIYIYPSHTSIASFSYKHTDAMNIPLQWIYHRAHISAMVYALHQYPYMRMMQWIYELCGIFIAMVYSYQYPYAMVYSSLYIQSSYICNGIFISAMVYSSYMSSVRNGMVHPSHHSPLHHSALIYPWMERWGGWGRDPKKCTGRDWGMGSSTI